MKTTVLPPDAAGLAHAAQVLRAGGLVAFPTETVYGLGANALDAAAVERIFQAKGRPGRNPLIVHVANATDAQALVRDWPDAASRLAEHFWPGPLSLVLHKIAAVPDVVTAGGATVAVRVPAHPVAQALLAAVEVPIAAPSANRSNQLSPTTAAHVLRDLDGRIDLLLDGGPTSGGLESTVLDVTQVPPRLLRPGLLTRVDIERVIGPIVVAQSSADETLRSPGMMGRHYAPRTPLQYSSTGWQQVQELTAAGKRIGWLTWARRPVDETRVTLIEMPLDAKAYAARLYAVLHDLDQLGLDVIVVDVPPETDEWLAIRDRLQRASL